MTTKKKTGRTGRKKKAKANTVTESPSDVTDASDKSANDVIENFAQRASEVVGRSAAILEEEIAAGIVAARQVEEKFIDVEKMRGGDQNRFGRKVRRDVHDVVDILVDLIESGVKTAGGLAQRAVRLQPTGGFGSRHPAPGNIPTLTSGAPLKPGSTGEISMTLENDSDAETEEFHFTSSDLINAAVGDQIASTQIKVSPSPVSIAPKGVCTVTIHVEVPVNTAPGVYSGLLQATRLDRLRAILTVQVS